MAIFRKNFDPDPLSAVQVVIQSRCAVHPVPTPNLAPETFLSHRCATAATLERSSPAGAWQVPMAAAEQVDASVASAGSVVAPVAASVAASVVARVSAALDHAVRRTLPYLTTTPHHPLSNPAASPVAQSAVERWGSIERHQTHCTWVEHRPAP